MDLPDAVNLLCQMGGYLPVRGSERESRRRLEDEVERYLVWNALVQAEIREHFRHALNTRSVKRSWNEYHLAS